MVFNAILKKYVVLLILYLNMYCDIAKQDDSALKEFYSELLNSLVTYVLILSELPKQNTFKGKMESIV